MEIEKIMDANVVCVGKNDSLHKVREIFENKKFHHLIVTEKGKMAGIISDRDYLKAISPAIGTAEETLNDYKSLDNKAYEIMTNKVIAIKKEISIKTAAQLMLVKNVSCLPVATMDGKIVGIVTLRKILKHYVEIDPDERAELDNYKSA